MNCLSHCGHYCVRYISDANMTTHTVCTVKGFFDFADLADFAPTVSVDPSLLAGVLLASAGVSLASVGDSPVPSLPFPVFTISVNAGVGHFVCHSFKNGPQNFVVSLVPLIFKYSGT